MWYKNELLNVWVCVRFKDGAELSAAGNDRLSMSADGDKYSLSITKTEKSDAGDYKISAVNETSRLSCSANLLVVGTATGVYLFYTQCF